MIPPDAEKMLREAKTIAVVGLSNDPTRASHGVSRYMQKMGYRIIPVNPKETEVLGEKSYARLEDIPEPVDIVDIFRQVSAVPGIVDSAIAIGAKGVWLQLGIVHDEALARAQAAGLLAVQDRCLFQDHLASGLGPR